MIAHPFTGAGRLAVGALITCLLGGTAGCGEEQIEERQLPKGAEQIPQGGGAGAQSESAAPQGGEAPWVVPQGWRQVPGERPMRLATFEAPDEAGPVEVAVTRFPGRVGGELANMNRWRGQMGLPPLEEAELEAAIERWEAPGHEGYQARIAGASGSQEHMLAAGVYEAAEDRTWFVRATAPAEVADRIEDDVWAFARSIAGAPGPAGAGGDSGAEGGGG